MPDLSSVAREAAERHVDGRPWADGVGVGFIAGFTECASRLPSEGEIAAEIEGNALLPPSDARDAARAVLALLGEKISG